MKPKDLPVFTEPAARRILDNACRQHGVTITLLRDLLAIDREHAGKGLSVGITQEFEARLGEFIDERENR